MVNLLKLFLIVLPLINLSQGMAAGICEPYIQQQEVVLQIPSHLLRAIAHTESGRLVSSSKKVVSWPWTINVNGKGYVYPTKKDAIEAVKKFQRCKSSSIDVGCMQVNLKHHPNAFRNLSDAFDPQLNVAYAAQFLKGLKNQYGSWHNAVAHYHSATPKYHVPYRQKVADRWQKIRKQNGNPFPVWQDMQFLSMSPMQQSLPQSQKPVAPKPVPQPAYQSNHRPTFVPTQLTFERPSQEEKAAPTVERVQLSATKFIPLNAHDGAGSAAIVTHKRYYPMNTENTDVEVSGSGRKFYRLN